MSMNRKIDFEQVIKNFDNSLRGNVLIKGQIKKMYPESAGSKFISSVVGHLRTVLIGINSLSNLDENVCKRRILNNGEAFIVKMVDDETVSAKNMEFLYQGYTNIFVDSYMGLRNKGHFSAFLKEEKENEFGSLEEKDRGLLEA